MPKNFLTPDQKQAMKSHMQKLMYTHGMYQTSPEPVSLFAKRFPSLVFYSRFLDVVFKASAKAKRAQYDDVEW